MQKRSILLRVLAAPLRHKIVAVGIAVAIASGFLVVARQVATPSRTAAMLSFEPAASLQLGRGALNATKDPAVTLAQSILSDEVEMGLARQVGPPFTGSKSDVVEFRSRLEMTQPSAKLLRVSYRHTDKKLSVAAANAVANLLAAWMPAPVATTLTSAPARESVPLAAPPLSQPNQQQRPLPSPSRALGELEGQLVATEEKLSALNAVPSQAGTSQTADADDASSNTANEQRRILEAQLLAAQKKLDDLRVAFTDEFPDVENAKEDIADVRQKLAALQPASGKAEKAISPQKPAVNTTEIDQLRQNRARLMQAIAVEKRHEARLRKASAEGNSSLAQQPVSPALPREVAVRQALTPVSPQILKRPFTLVRLAGVAETGQSARDLFWYSALAGMFCGLVYMCGAIWRYPQTEIAASLDQPELNQSPVAENATPHAGSFIHSEAPWTEEVVKPLSRTDLSQEDETFAARNGVRTMDIQEKVDISNSGLRGKAHHDEVLAVVRENVERNPKSWRAHAEEARIALSIGDTDTAIRAMKLATTVAPEELRAQLGMILLQLDGNVSVNK
jgi:hypothetical protein